MSDGMNIIAVLDTNVLFPPVLRDMLLYAAAFRLYRPVWSAQTWEELRRNLIAKGGLSQEVAARRMDYMARAFPDALVVSSPNSMAVLINDPKDRHVLAAAIDAGAGMIVTQNLKDSPPAALSEHGIRAMDADTFLRHLLATDEDRLVQSIRHYASRLRHPPMTPRELLSEISRHAPEFVAAAESLLST